VSIQIIGPTSSVIGELRLLQLEDLENRELLELLAVSRNHYKGSFLTTSISDANTTKKFLLDILESRTKFIFLIYIFRTSSKDAYLYGHLGYEIIDNHRVEVINVMKIPDRNSNVQMLQPLSTLISFLQRTFSESQIFLKVLTSNIRAMTLYSSCGFKVSIKESTDEVSVMILQ
jgi:hypothetical protein